MHDARHLDHYPPGSHRVEAKNPWVWIRYEGAWRRGAIHCWYVHGDTWMAWMQHDDPAPDFPWARWGLYHYDGATIRRRYAPAATARVETPDGRARRQIATLLRETGYSVRPGDGAFLIVG